MNYSIDFTVEKFVDSDGSFVWHVQDDTEHANAISITDEGLNSVLNQIAAIKQKENERN